MKPRKDKLVRFGVAMEDSLLGDFDRIVAARGSTRSEAFRDIARAWVSKSRERTNVEAVAALTFIYRHHVRDLTDTLTDIQHDLGDQVRSAMHVHLTHDLCLEVIVLKGRADALQSAADRILGTRGVTHGGIEIFAMGEAAKDARGDAAHGHDHHEGAHVHPPVTDRPAKTGRGRRR